RDSRLRLQRAPCGSSTGRGAPLTQTRSSSAEASRRREVFFIAGGVAMPSTVEQRHQEVATASQEIAESTIAYFEGAFVPLADAKISIATHALQYGTAVFEGIRAYWNPAREQLYVFRLREHFERMAGSVRILRVALPGDASELARITVELLKRNSFRNDVYIR